VSDKPTRPDRPAEALHFGGDAKFVPLAALDHALLTLARDAFALAFAAELRLDARLRAKAAAALEILLANGTVQLFFEGVDRGMCSWNGTPDGVIDIAHSLALQAADAYKEDRNRYGDRQWG
jgi:environmental stress-induced protein Ves